MVAAEHVARRRAPPRRDDAGAKAFGQFTSLVDVLRTYGAVEPTTNALASLGTLVASLHAEPTAGLWSVASGEVSFARER